MSATIVGSGRGPVDIVVLKIPIQLVRPEFKFTPSVGEFFFGQDVYFMGFPYKMWGDVGALLEGRAAAFVKKGTLSFVSTGAVREFFVDAINNEGFSGGPMFFYPKQDPNDIRVIGVVSKFRTEREPVVTQTGEATNLEITYNTGFMLAYGINHVLDIVRSQYDV